MPGSPLAWSSISFHKPNGAQHALTYLIRRAWQEFYQEAASQNAPPTPQGSGIALSELPRFSRWAVRRLSRTPGSPWLFRQDAPQSTKSAFQRVEAGGQHLAI
jgi:hypothetical protein